MTYEGGLTGLQEPRRTGTTALLILRRPQAWPNDLKRNVRGVYPNDAPGVVGAGYGAADTFRHANHDLDKLRVCLRQRTVRQVGVVFPSDTDVTTHSHGHCHQRPLGKRASGS